jgi:hypothetical protein
MSFPNLQLHHKRLYIQVNLLQDHKKIIFFLVGNKWIKECMRDINLPNTYFLCQNLDHRIHCFPFKVKPNPLIVPNNPTTLGQDENVAKANNEEGCIQVI